MEFKSPLSQRIVVSLVLLTTVVSGLFGLGVILAVHYVEESLITDELQQEFAYAIEDHQNGRVPRLDYATEFVAAGPGLPAYLRSLPPGFSEVVQDERAYFVYLASYNDRAYYLIRDQTAFEKREKFLNMVVFGGFVLSVVVALALGLMLARKVIAPVQRLTLQVRDREKLLPGTPPLSSDYADDEIGTLARVFDATIDRLQQALQRESLFTSDVSHELRTPLMVIKSSCDLLAEKPGLDGFSRQRLAMICAAADDMQKLVEAFLSLARGREVGLETLTLPALIRRERQGWEQMAAAKGLAFDIRGDAGAAVADLPAYPEIMLRTVIDNLICNAVRHTVAGGITLHLRPDGFTLCDTGSGIATEEKAAVFKPYYRGDTAVHNGIGLGLSLVQRICEREEWTVHLEDNQPNGCCFAVTLNPAARSAVSAMPS